MDELESLLDDWLAAHAAGEGTLVVIGGLAGARDRVRWLDPEQAKGLEFDAVILVEPERWSPVDQYLSMTRSSDTLIILSNGET